MRFVLRQPYKSFAPPFRWDLPQFAFLTGVNGAGKTQLMELLFRTVTGESEGQFEDQSVDYKECIYFKSGWQLEQPSDFVSHHNIAQTFQEAVSQLFAKSNAKDPHRLVLSTVRETISQLAGKEFYSIEPDEVRRLIPIRDVQRILHGSRVESSILAQSIYRYHLRAVSLVYANRGKAFGEDDIRRELGESPCDTFNSILSAIGLNYELVAPEKQHFDEQYNLRFRKANGTRLAIDQLSAGERFLLGLAILLLNCRLENRPPKLLLMDEPDAHLHPALISRFVSSLREIGKVFGCRIIATTHRPDTIVLCESEEIFEVFPEGDRIRRCKSRADVIARISANLLSVLPNTRCVLVEDDDDVAFYKAITAIAIQDPSIVLQPIPIFQAVSAGRGPSKTGGGKTVVENWVKKLAEARLEKLIVGLIDRDSGNVGNENTVVISRYSIENFLLDPIVVFCRLVDQGTAPSIQGIQISRGEEHKLRELPDSDLQRIADSILEPVTRLLPNAAAGTFPVKFLSGQTLSYPVWLRDTRGHDLRGHFFAVYDRLATDNEMLKAFERARMIPMELIDTLQAVCA